jgi:hypothetical protein
MSSSPDEAKPLWAHAPPSSLRWDSWPAGENALAGFVVAVSLAAVGLLVHRITAQVHLAALSVGAVSLALWRFFLPIRYELNQDGVQQWILGGRRGIPWDSIRRYEVCRTGVLLLPFHDDCTMDAFRGLYLPWGNRRDEVLARIRYYVDRESWV